MSYTDKPTQIETERVLHTEKFVVTPVHWVKTRQAWRLNIKVHAYEYPTELRLVGFIGKTNHSFALLYRDYPIRKYTKHTPHQIGGVLYHKPHKHVWDGEDEHNEAYIPDDINPSDNINQQFLDFCHECHIEIQNDYHWIDYQRRS